MYCEVHDQGGVLQDCEVCKANAHVLRQQQRVLEELQEKQQRFDREADDRRRKEGEQRARDNAEAQERRHEELLEIERARAEAEERRHEEATRLASEQREAEERWYEEQSREREREAEARELREGLQAFDAQFQQEWLATNEALDAYRRSRAELAARINQAAQQKNAEDYQARSAISQLKTHLLGLPIDAHVVPIPPEGGTAWTRFARASHRVADNPFLSSEGWRIATNQPNLLAVWHLLHRIASPKLTSETPRATLPSSAPPLGGLLGCLGVLAVQAAFGVMGLAAGVVLLDGWTVARSVAILFFSAPICLVLSLRAYASSSLFDRGLIRALEELRLATTELLACMPPGGRTRPPAPQLPRRLQHSGETWVKAAFGPLLTWAETVFDATVDLSSISVDDTSSKLAAHIRQVRGRRDSYAHNEAVLRAQGDTAEGLALAKRYSYMEAEIRRVGRQVISGIRVRSAPIKLVQCPACSGPVSAETAKCPYCGSMFARA